MASKDQQGGGLLGGVIGTLDNTLTGGEREDGQGGLLGGVGNTLGGLGKTTGQATSGLLNTTKNTTDSATSGLTDTAGKTVGGLTGQNK